MTELCIWEQDRTRQRFCRSLEEAIEDAKAELALGKPVQIIPHGEPDEAP